MLSDKHNALLQNQFRVSRHNNKKSSIKESKDVISRVLAMMTPSGSLKSFYLLRCLFESEVVDQIFDSVSSVAFSVPDQSSKLLALGLRHFFLKLNYTNQTRL